MLLGLILTQLLIAIDTPNHWVYSWYAVLLGFLGLRYRFAQQFLQLSRRKQEIPSQIIRKHSWIQAGVIFVIGLLWAFSLALLIQVEKGIYLYGYQMLALTFAVGIIGVGVGILSAIPKVFFLFSTPIALTVITTFYLSAEVGFQYYTILGTLLGFVFFALSSLKFSKHFDATILQNLTIQKREMEIINRLGMASEFRDSETWNHINRMSQACYLLALEAGYSKEKAKLIKIASSLHDVGKVGISDTILLKADKLTDEERQEIQKHTSIGAKILADSDSEMIQLANIIAMYHHERYDGSGYPFGLKAEEIPEEARIAAICDVYDALTSERPYKKAWTAAQSLAYLVEHAGSHFDPKLVDHFVKIHPQIIQYADEHADHA